MAGASWMILFVQCSSSVWLLRFDRCSRPWARLSWLLAEAKLVLCCGSRLLSASGPAACRLACRCQAAPPKQGLQPHSSGEEHRRLPGTLRFQSLQGFFLSSPARHSPFLQDRSTSLALSPYPRGSRIQNR